MQGQQLIVQVGFCNQDLQLRYKSTEDNHGLAELGFLFHLLLQNSTKTQARYKDCSQSLFVCTCKTKYFLRFIGLFPTSRTMQKSRTCPCDGRQFMMSKYYSQFCTSYLRTSEAPCKLYFIELKREQCLFNIQSKILFQS